MSSPTSNIYLVCFIHGETGKDIFSVVIDNNSTVKNLEVEIRKVYEIGPIHIIVYLQKVLEKNPEDTGL
ncbi:hypothetical protein C1646_688168 [Rhizophagus diaphanus]|nr:hypothetical protein C1646_688168 [Rhizophagus diaphanus] [Rhizophagus sp. MUCL 43196]